MRVTGKKRDDLQQAIALLKSEQGPTWLCSTTISAIDRRSTMDRGLIDPKGGAMRSLL